MKTTLRWGLLCGAIGLTPASWAQEPTPSEGKSAAQDDKGNVAKPKEDGSKPAAGEKSAADQEKGEQAGQSELGRVQREVQAAQRAVAKAQAEAKRAQAEVLRAQGEAQRAQAAAQRAQAGAQRASRDPRPYYAGPFKYTVVRDGNSRQVRAFRSPSEFVQAFGLDFVPADPTLRAQLGLAPSEGLVVTAVVAGGPADKAGIRKDDVIAKLDGKPARAIPEAQGVIADVGKPAVVVDLIRAGKPVELTWTKPEPPASKEPYYIGVYLAPVDGTLRSQLPALPEGAGMVVTEVTSDSPAAKADVKKYDIAIKIDDRPIKENSDLSDQIQKTGGEPIKLTLIRAGEPKTLAMTPVRRPSSQAAQYTISINSDDVFKDVTRLLNEGKPGDGSPQPPIGAVTLPPGIQNLTRDVQDRLEKQVKELNKQMEGLQKTIEAANKGRAEELRKEIEALLERRSSAVGKDGKAKDEK